MRNWLVPTLCLWTSGLCKGVQHSGTHSLTISPCNHWMIALKSPHPVAGSIYHVMWLLKHFGIKSKSIFAPHFRYFSDCVRFIMQIHIYNLSFNPWPSGTKYVDILAMKFYLLQNLSGMKIQRKSELVTRWKVQDLFFILLCLYHNTSFCFVFLCSIWVFFITLYLAVLLGLSGFFSG